MQERDIESAAVSFHAQYIPEKPKEVISDLKMFGMIISKLVEAERIPTLPVTQVETLAEMFPISTQTVIAVGPEHNLILRDGTTAHSVVGALKEAYRRGEAAGIKVEKKRAARE